MTKPPSPLSPEHLRLVRDNPDLGWPEDVKAAARAHYTAQLRGAVGPVRTPEALPVDLPQPASTGAELTRLQHTIALLAAAAVGAGAALVLVGVV